MLILAEPPRVKFLICLLPLYYAFLFCFHVSIVSISSIALLLKFLLPQRSDFLSFYSQILAIFSMAFLIFYVINSIPCRSSYSIAFFLFRAIIPILCHCSISSFYFWSVLLPSSVCYKVGTYALSVVNHQH